LKELLSTSLPCSAEPASGLLILAIALDLLGIKRLPVGNLLPAIFISIGLHWTFGLA
jgi:uncharacterized protein